MMPILLIPVILIGICATGFWIWMLVDCLNNQNLSGSQRCCWALFILFAHLIGAIAYAIVLRTSQTIPLVPVSQRRREFMPSERYRSYQEGYPSRHFSQDTQASSEPAPFEPMSIPSQARYEEIQLSYPESPH